MRSLLLSCLLSCLLALSACAPVQDKCVSAAEAEPAPPAVQPAAAPAPTDAHASRSEFFLGNVREIVAQNPLGAEEKARVTKAFESADHTLNVIQTRGAVPAHYHADHDELVVILDGGGTFTIEGKTREVKAGDVQVIPRGAVHSYVHQGPGTTVVLSTFSPRFDPKDRIMVDAPKP